MLLIPVLFFCYILVNQAFLVRNPPPILVFGHRGTTVHRPENTLLAFQYAVDAAGVAGFETDLRLTKDEHVVLLHDATLERTTNCTGAVEDFTWAQLSHCDACSWFNSSLHCQIPRFEEALDLALRQNQTIIMHLKVEFLHTPLRKIFRAFPSFASTLVIASCQSTTQLTNFTLALPSVVPQRVDTQWKLPQGAEWSPPWWGFFQREVALGVRGYSLNCGTLPLRFVPLAHRHLLSVISWVVNTKKQLVTLREVGIDGVITDDPQRTLRILSELPP